MSILSEGAQPTYGTHLQETLPRMGSPTVTITRTLRAGCCVPLRVLTNSVEDRDIR